MNLILMRHGEAEHNQLGKCSAEQAILSRLTDTGRQQVIDTVAQLDHVDFIYASPLVRTLQTAQIVQQKFPDASLVIDARIRELDSGDCEGDKSCSLMDEIRKAQVAGDYFIRFGRDKLGENKFEIELRLSEFLSNLEHAAKAGDTILLITHGTVASFIKRILRLKAEHTTTGKAQIFTDVNLSPTSAKLQQLYRIATESQHSRIDPVGTPHNNAIRLYHQLNADYINTVGLSDEAIKHVMDSYNKLNLNS